MKLLPIQNQPNLQVFKGLSSEVSSEPVQFGDNIKYFESSNYYPFKNEPQERVDAFVKEASVGYYGTGMEIDRHIYVKEALPFTEQEFADYKTKHVNGKPMGETELMIDKYLSEHYGLRRFMNVIPEPPKPQETETLIKKIIKSLSKFFK